LAKNKNKNKNKTKKGKLDPRPYTYQALTENIYTRKKNMSLFLGR
jgi:hypothetical protein